MNEDESLWINSKYPCSLEDIVCDNGRSSSCLLTPRRLQIYELMGQGKSGREIRRELGMAKSSLYTAVDHIKRTFGFEFSDELRTFAINEHLRRNPELKVEAENVYGLFTDREKEVFLAMGRCQDFVVYSMVSEIHMEPSTIKYDLRNMRKKSQSSSYKLLLLAKAYLLPDNPVSESNPYPSQAYRIIMSSCQYKEMR